MKRQKNENLFLTIIVALILTTVMFVLIFGFASLFTHMNYKTIQEKNNEISNDLESIEKRIENFVCEDNLLELSSENLDNSGSRIELLEKRFGLNDERVLEVKKLYLDLEYAHLNLVDRFNNECQRNISIILFFYENKEYFERANDRTSFVLRTYKRDNPSEVMIYSFDNGLEYNLTSFLREKHNITALPVVVVNNEEPFKLINIDQLRELLEN